MSEKCSHHKDKRKRLIGRVFKGVILILFVALVIFLLIWVILQPKKPQFTLDDASLFSLNATYPNVVTINLQITVFIRNRNDRIGVYYDKLNAYASYHDQLITLYTTIPAFYQGHNENSVWSPFLYGQETPVATYNGIALREDQSNGQVQLVIKIHGRVRFKVGAFISRHYRLYVKCPTIMTFGSRSNGIKVGDSIKYTLGQSCSVSL